MIRPLAAALLIAATGAQAQDSGMRTAEGSLTYLPRIALPDDASVAIQVTGLRGAIIGETAFGTEGAQVPLPFLVEFPAGTPANLTATIAGPDGILFSAGPVAVAAGTDAVALGEIVMDTGGPVVDMLCGTEPVTAAYRPGAVELTFRNQNMVLDQTMSGSGARYELSSDPGTVFWNKGQNATLTLAGTDLPECRPEAAAARYRAAGNEPFWAFIAEGGSFTFSRPHAADVTGTLPDATWEDGAAVWSLPDAGLTVRMTPALCQDSMSGMLFPETVRLTADGAELSGCGGDPASLLTGAEWVVEDVNGAGIIDDSHVTLAFGADGSLSGSGGCNRIAGGYELSGEGLNFPPLAATMMACPEALMNQEQAVFMALDSVTGFDIGATGELLLRDATGKAVITARR